MALVISASYFEPCNCCGRVEHSQKEGVRTHVAYCYPEGKAGCGHEVLLGRGLHAPSRSDLGWHKRGKWPICPAHVKEGDVPIEAGL